MSNIVRVNNVELVELVSRGQRVLTYEMVADVHGANVNALQQAYSRNSDHFKDGKHTWIIEGEELQILRRLLTLGQSVPSLRVFTERGYYLLIKPMRDEISWRVQEEMADTYFAVNHGQVSIRQLEVPTLDNRMSQLRSALEMAESFGILDDYTRALARERIQNHIVEIGKPIPYSHIPELPQTTKTDAFFMIEDIRGHLKVSDKDWIKHRGAFGKAARAVIQAADPECQPQVRYKIIQGSERPVNAWPNEYKDIAIAAIEQYMAKAIPGVMASR